MRLLVTGSREARDRAPIWDALDAEYTLWWRTAQPGEEFIVTHGAARGADTFASEWCHARSNLVSRITEDAHPADWSGGRIAGHIRNVEMVQLGPEVVLAFFQVGAPNVGTRHCVTEAHRWLDHRGVRIVEVWLDA
jgi:hypothetical protein